MLTDGANMRLPECGQYKITLAHLHARFSVGSKSTSPRGSGTAHGARAGRLTGARPLPAAVATEAAASCAPAACWAGGCAHAPRQCCGCKLKERPRADQPARRRLPGSRMLLDLDAAVSWRASPFPQPSRGHVVNFVETATAVR